MRTRLATLAALLLIGSGCADHGVLQPASTRPSSQAATIAVGAAQSPIDLRSDIVVTVGKHDLPSLKYRYAGQTSLTLENTGSPDEETTVRANVPAGAGTLRLGDRVYTLVQFHWHVPSEHLVNGYRFPMEMHLVHNAADGSTLVTAVFIRVGARNATLAPIFANLPEQAGATEPVARFDLAKLLPHDDRESVRYVGSLTTPPFTEGVQWVVLTEPIELSPSQIAAFKGLYPEGNSREAQPLNGRTVLTDVKHF